MEQSKINEIKSRKRRFSKMREMRWRDHVVVLSVFAIGLILTAGCFSFLSVNIRHLLKKENAHSVSSILRTAQNNIYDIENTLDTLDWILSFEDNAIDKKDRRDVNHNNLVEIIPNLKKFNIIVALDLKKSFTSPEYIYRNYNERGLFMTDSLKLTSGFLEFLENEKTLFRNSSQGDISILSNLPAPPVSYNEGQFSIQYRPIAFVKFASENRDKVLIGLTNMSNIFDSMWLSQYSNMHSMSVIDSQLKKPIYSMRSEYGNSKETFANIFPIKLDHSELEFSYVMGQAPGAAMLSKVPGFILFIGIFSTILSTLYVRNTQNQSQHLKSINLKLESKNQALNTEIAERERLNYVLKDADLEYKSLINSVSDVIIELGPEGEIIFLNKAWETITGFSVDQSLERSFFDWIHPQDQEDQLSKFKELVRGNMLVSRSYTNIRDSEGRFRAVELSISVLRTENTKRTIQKATRIVGTLTDIEERRRTEKALSEAEKKYRAIVENSVGGFFQITPEGHFLSANAALVNLLGFRSQEQMLKEIKNAHHYLFKDEGTRVKFARDLDSLNVINGFETEILRANHQTVWGNINARIVRDENDNIMYYEGTVENITQRKEAELKLKDAIIKANLASRAKSEFLSNMSHELRTPLNSIIGFSELLKNEAFGPLENQQYKDYSYDIYNSGKALLNIINDILDISKIESGDRRLDESRVSMKKVLGTVLSLVSKKPGAQKISVSDLSSDTVPDVIGDETALKQIFSNILSNAVKYTPAGGRVTISHELDSEGALRLSVTDTGIGLDARQIEKALSPFGQIDTGHSKSEFGAGLGLALVDSLVKLHGGELELVSQKDIGTTATIVLPVKRVASVSGGQSNQAQNYDEDSQSGLTASDTTSLPHISPDKLN